MKRLISLLAVCVTVGMMPLFLVLAGVIDGAICTDFFEQIIPLTMESKRMLSSGMPLWSWNSFLGDNFIGANNFYVLGTPFTLICCLFPYEYIWIGLILCLYLQFILYGVSAMYYFRRMGFEDRLARIGAVMYSMSSFCIMAVFYFNFAIGFILFPIFLICIENLIDRRRYSFIALAAIVAAMVIANFYFAALSMLGGGMYFVCRILFNKEKRCLRTFALFFAAVALGIALSAVLFIPTILCTMGSGRNAVGNPFYGIVTTIIFDSVKLLYFFLPRLTEGFETAIYAPYANFSFYLPCVGYAFVICYCIRNLKSWLTCLIVLCIVILLSPLNLIFSLGANASYGRWGYILILFAILSTLYCIRDKQFTSKEIRKYVLYASIYVFAMVTYKLVKVSDLKSIIAVLLEVGLYIVGAIWLIVIAKSKNPERSIYQGAVCIGTLNMLLYTSLLVFSFHTDGVNNKLSRRDADSEFVYRTDIVSPERNSTYTANRPATETFHSVFNKNLKDFGICFRGDNDAHFFVTHHRESFDALTSVKEVVLLNKDGSVSFSVSEAS